ncbi:hypothetical protein [Methanosarcina spelaei]|uniref:hypothetical protein n=1 Tax=Methanosarcina spelaei TaxID=1036679 RepID=UPI001482D9AA|nr:hypothetical protein [Methanosarcina spelaei]
MVKANCVTPNSYYVISVKNYITRPSVPKSIPYSMESSVILGSIKKTKFHEPALKNQIL